MAGQLYWPVFVPPLSTEAFVYLTIEDYVQNDHRIAGPQLQVLQPLRGALLAVGAFLALGWQKKIDPFKLALLIFACIFAFRTWRDAWFVCVTAAAIIADFPISEDKRDRSLGLSGWAAVSLASILLLLLAVRNTDFNTRGLDRAISHEYPVNAVNFLRRNPVGGPLYNSFDFGGFLIFYMPQYPVSIDGRTDLYGNAMDEQYFSTQEADPSYTTDPLLNEAGVVILKNKFPIAGMLLTDRRFRVIYRDDIATVFVRQLVERICLKRSPVRTNDVTDSLLGRQIHLPDRRCRLVCISLPALVGSSVPWP